MFSYKAITVFALLTGVLGGCVSVQMPEIAHTHPAHPDAERPTAPNVPSVLAVPADPVAAPPLNTSAETTPSPAGHTGHGGHDAHAEPAPTAPEPPAEGVYVCPMHPEIVSDEPGTCPLCGMDLELQGE